MKKLIATGVVAISLGALSVPAVAVEATLQAEILNFSEMNRWVQVTDLVCGTVLYKDTMDAQAKVPVQLCPGEDGLGKVQLYVRIGCTKNKTHIKEGIAEGATVNF